MNNAQVALLAAASQVPMQDADEHGTATTHTAGFTEQLADVYLAWLDNADCAQAAADAMSYKQLRESVQARCHH